jgi:hypothetical protein
VGWNEDFDEKPPVNKLIKAVRHRFCVSFCILDKIVLYSKHYLPGGSRKQHVFYRNREREDVPPGEAVGARPQAV